MSNHSHSYAVEPQLTAIRLLARLFLAFLFAFVVSAILVNGSVNNFVSIL